MKLKPFLLLAISSLFLTACSTSNDTDLSSASALPQECVRLKDASIKFMAAQGDPNPEEKWNKIEQKLRDSLKNNKQNGILQCQNVALKTERVHEFLFSEEAKKQPKECLEAKKNSIILLDLTEKDEDRANLEREQIERDIQQIMKKGGKKAAVKECEKANKMMLMMIEHVAG